jgi:hypothetical protein
MDKRDIADGDRNGLPPLKGIIRPTTGITPIGFGGKIVDYTMQKEASKNVWLDALRQTLKN